MANEIDPTLNVKESIKQEVGRLDDVRHVEIKRLDDKIEIIDEKNDAKYQVQFNDAKEAVNTAFTAQEKAIAAALAGTKEAINKSDATTDKRFDLLSEKIDGIAETISKNTGAQGIYVTHSDLSVEMEKLRTSFESMLRPVITFMNNSQGRSGGLNSGWVYLIGGVGLVATIMSIITVVMNFSK